MSEALRVRAAVLRAPRTPLSIETVLLEPPREGEVLVRLAAAGVCHSDLHLVEGHLVGDRTPAVPGHEGAGVVEAVGAGVGRVSPGERVALCFIPSCGECAQCRAGRGNLCVPGSAASFGGTMLDGTTRLRLEDGTPLKHFLAAACFAERCVVPEASVVPLPSALPLWQASLVGCAVVTGFGAVRNAARLGPNEAVCVVGCGGVGLQVIAAARLAGADPVVAVDLEQERLELARARGATHVVDAAADDPAAAIQELTDGGVQYAFEVVGRAASIRLAWQTLRPGGTVIVVGLAPAGVEAAVPAVDFLSEKSLRGSFYGSGKPAEEIAELAALVADGRLDLAATISHTTSLVGIEEAFERMRRGRGARTVVVLDPELAGLPSAARPEAVTIHGP
jgi:S-(hydroxymethyl)glutathione dehydrogenase / alcohol dehydrogenase